MAGEILKQRREELGRGISEIADLLKIKADYLIAIEHDNFEKLPAPVYTSGYIRCYAAYLKVDADAIVEFYTSRLAQPAATTIIPVGYSHKKAPRILYVITALIVIGVAAYFIIPVITTIPMREGVSVQPPPSQSPAPRAPVAQAPVDQQPPPEAASPSAGAGAWPAGQHRLTVSCVAKAWLMVRFKDGKSEEMLMKPDEIKVWDFSDQLVMKLGNAGGVRLNLDGQDLGSPGGAGEVKTITLPPQ